MINRWELIDRIEELEKEGILSCTQAEGLITEANLAAYNQDYDDIRRIEKEIEIRSDKYSF